MTKRMRDPFDPLKCDAGRRADFGGRWRVPCGHVFVEGDNLNTLGWPGGEEWGGPLHFCDRHMRELIDAGLITDVDVGEEAFEAFRRGEREPGMG